MPPAEPVPFIVYRDKVLPRSETFIPRHYGALERWQPHWTAISRVAEGYDMGETPVTAINAGGLGGLVAEARFRTTGAAPAIDRRIDETGSTLIHAHFGKSGARILPLARRRGLPLVVSFHGGDATKTGHFRPFWRTGSVFAQRLAAMKEYAALYLTDSAFLKGKLVERGFPADRIEPYHIGIDTDAYVPDPTLDRSLVVLFVGRFVEKKGTRHLIDAMAEVQRQLPDCALALIGDGPERAALEAQAKACLRNVRFIGWQTPAQVRQWMNRCRLLAVPSVTASNGDCEGTPSTVFEGHAMGLPVVGTRHSGIPEAVVDGETGLLCGERDSRALAQNILTILSEDGLWDRMSLAARQHAETAFATAVRCRALEALFDRAAGRS